nr:uncharacterized protein LOC119717510 isoform X2 [Anas platyrhynchos]
MQAVLGRGIRLCPPRGLPKAPWGAGEGRGAAVGAPHSGAAILQPCPLPGLCWKVLGIGVPPAVVLAAPRLLGVLSAPGTAPINERPLLSPALHSHGADGCLILRHPSPGWGHGAGPQRAGEGLAARDCSSTRHRTSWACTTSPTPRPAFGLGAAAQAIWTERRVPLFEALRKALLNANSIEYEFEIVLRHRQPYRAGRYACCGETARNSVCENALPHGGLSCGAPESPAASRSTIGDTVRLSLLPARDAMRSCLQDMRRVAEATERCHRAAAVANVTGRGAGGDGGGHGHRGAAAGPHGAGHGAAAVSRGLRRLAAREPRRCHRHRQRQPGVPGEEGRGGGAAGGVRGAGGGVHGQPGARGEGAEAAGGAGEGREPGRHPGGVQGGDRAGAQRPQRQQLWPGPARRWLGPAVPVSLAGTAAAAPPRPLLGPGHLFCHQGLGSPVPRRAGRAGGEHPRGGRRAGEGLQRHRRVLPENKPHSGGAGVRPGARKGRASRLAALGRLPARQWDAPQEPSESVVCDPARSPARAVLTCPYPAPTAGPKPGAVVPAAPSTGQAAKKPFQKCHKRYNLLLAHPSRGWFGAWVVHGSKYANSSTLVWVNSEETAAPCRPPCHD